MYTNIQLMLLGICLDI